MYTSRFSSYRLQTTHLFNTTAYEKHTIWRMQSEMVRFPCQRGTPSSQKTESFFRVVGGGWRWQLWFCEAPASTARPCFVEFTIIGTHVWQYDVCWELRQVSPIISWHTAESGAAWVNRQSYLWWNTKRTAGGSSQANPNHLRSSVWCKLLFGQFEFHTCVLAATENVSFSSRQP